MSHLLVKQIDNIIDRVIFEADFPNLTPSQLFEAFTKADQLTQWWPQAAEVEAKLGGTYHLSWPSMGWHLRGNYTAFEPAKTLGFTWQWDHQPELPQRQVMINIARLASGSSLRIEHGYYGQSDEELEDRQSHIDGWHHFLERLQRL